MERLAYGWLSRWKLSRHRKPLIIQGARQVGKTWLMKEFGKREYKQVAYVNFESSSALKSIFLEDYDIGRLIMAFQIETGIRIQADNTLILLDEIQEAENGITSLKYFCENAPQYHIIAAGSLLGITLHHKSSFPVGKVDLFTLYPLSFQEFLLALGQADLVNLIHNLDWHLINHFKAKILGLLRQYYFIGGMPEAVGSFISENDFTLIRTIQKNILTAYEHDFSKHAPTDLVPRIKMLWQSLPSQLAKENKKFIYGVVKQGGRAKEFELALAWLTQSGIVYKVPRISKAAFPLAAYEDVSAFKIFILDCGLLAAMGGLSQHTILEGNKIFSEFKGALAEQYVLQHLKLRPEVQIFYWSSDTSRAELDFVIQDGERIIPVEVKAEENLQAKSLKSFYQKFGPDTSLRISMSNYRKDEWLTNVPLYALEASAF
jgi:predicted AAA+ superfamily ATPase